MDSSLTDHYGAPMNSLRSGAHGALVSATNLRCVGTSGDAAAWTSAAVVRTTHPHPPAGERAPIPTQEDR